VPATNLFKDNWRQAEAWQMLCFLSNRVSGTI